MNSNYSFFVTGAPALAIILCFLALSFSIFGMIFKRAGYSFWLAIVMFIPLVNVIRLVIFAFSKWPIQRELEIHRGGDRGFPVIQQPPQQ